VKRIRIGPHDYTLYGDYERGHYHLLNLTGKIVYMKARVARDLIKPCCIALRFADCIHVGLLVPTLVCSGVSAASTFQNGREAPTGHDRNYFVGFVHDYMDAIFQHNARDPSRPTDTYGDWLYRHVRCALSHGSKLGWGRIQGRKLSAHILPHPVSGEPQIDQHWLLDDFANGWIAYLTAVNAGAGTDIAVKFETRFDKLFQD
jgi:hypothetical protein